MHFYPSDQKQWNLSLTHLLFFFSHSSLSQKAKISSEISHVSFSLVSYHASLSLWPAVKSLIHAPLSFFSHSSLYILNLSQAKSTEHSPKAVQIRSLSSIIYSLLSFFFRDRSTNNVDSSYVENVRGRPSHEERKQSPAEGWCDNWTKKLHLVPKPRISMPSV